MSGKTNIAWTDVTWNPVTGCSKVSPGCANSALKLAEAVTGTVVATDEPPRPMSGVVLIELRATSASTLQQRVWLVWALALKVLTSVLRRMVVATGDNLKVLWTIIGLVPVTVVDEFTLAERTAKNLLSYQSVLVDVAARVSTRVLREFHEHVTVRGDGPSTLPIGILVRRWEQGLYHESSLTHGVLHGKEVMPYA